MTRALRWRAPIGPSIECIGRPDARWSGDAAWTSEGCTFVRIGDRVHGLDHAAASVVTDGERAVVDGRWVVEASGCADVGQHTRLGLDLALQRRRPGGWHAPFDLPRTARVSPSTRPYARGIGVAWWGSGIVCTLDASGRRARASWTAEWTVGPHGALMLGTGEAWSAGAAPGRTPLPLPATLHGAVDWSDDGCTVTGRDGDDTTVTVHLPNRTLQPSPTHPRHRVGTALTVGGPAGWLAVDHTGAARWATPDWTPKGTHRIPLERDDAVDRGEPTATGFRLWSALGGCWDVEPSGVRPARHPRPARSPPSTVRLGAVRIRTVGHATVGGHGWAWTRAGLLLRDVEG
ncbi:MAG: hypothetical protein ACI8PZ_005343 [Myxococcota bacterium]|jgi:hypothetical protein